MRRLSNQLKTLTILGIMLVGFSCQCPNKYQCPYDGGTYITIEQQNPGDENKIIAAIEKAMGADCCQIDESFADDIIAKKNTLGDAEKDKEVLANFGR